jgi:uncharacterized protein
MIEHILFAAAVAGAVYPSPKEQVLNDFAGVVSTGDAQAIRAVADQVRAQHGVPIVVATINSLADQDAAGWSIERYGTNLYNEWGIGDKTSNRGVLLLVSVRDRKLRIAAGAGLVNSDGEAEEVVNSVIVPRFKRGQMSEGIRAGVEAIAGWFGPGGVAGRPAAAAAPPPRPAAPDRIPSGGAARWTPNGTGVIHQTQKSGGGIGMFFLILLVVVGIGIAVSIFRSFSRVAGGGLGGSGVPGGSSWMPGASSGSGWGGFLLGGLTGFLGSQLLQRTRSSHEWGGGGTSSGGGDVFSGGGGGGFSCGGGGSSFGGGFSSGGGASGSW